MQRSVFSICGVILGRRLSRSFSFKYYEQFQCAFFDQWYILVTFLRFLYMGHAFPQGQSFCTGRFGQYPPALFGAGVIRVLCPLPVLVILSAPSFPCVSMCSSEVVIHFRMRIQGQTVRTRRFGQYPPALFGAGVIRVLCPLPVSVCDSFCSFVSVCFRGFFQSCDAFPWGMLWILS